MRSAPRFSNGAGVGSADPGAAHPCIGSLCKTSAGTVASGQSSGTEPDINDHVGRYLSDGVPE